MPDTTILTDEQVAEKGEVMLKKAFDGEVYYWYEDGKSRAEKSTVQQDGQVENKAGMLTLNEISAIEAHYPNPEKWADVHALCQTVRALRAQLAQCEGSRRVHELDNHHNALACGYCAGPLKDELTRLQKIVEQLK